MEQQPQVPDQKFKSPFAAVGFVIAFIALIILVLIEYGVFQKPTPQKTLTELAIEAGKKALGVEEQKQDLNTEQLISVLCGLVALFCSLVGWIKKENLRLSIAGIIVALIVLGWQYFKVALTVTFLIIILSVVGLFAS